MQCIIVKNAAQIDHEERANWEKYENEIISYKLLCMQC